MYSNDREVYRQTFINAWCKYQQQILLEPFEAEIIDVILSHPDYQLLLNSLSRGQQQEYTLEENPFLHMSLHLAIREQVKTNRPFGIKDLYQTLNAMPEKFMNAHEVEHAMMACLGKMIWAAQQNGIMPQEAAYLAELEGLK
ncbi:MAG: DUF1841 family protein [Gammaproteobacteria bacterium]|nr:DUF1841 family protein [Gammaproteobacteria bacterium]